MFNSLKSKDYAFKFSYFDRIRGRSFPNLSQNTLHFTISTRSLSLSTRSLSEVETSITLYSLTGQMVLQTPFVSTSSTNAAGETNTISGGVGSEDTAKGNNDNGNTINGGGVSGNMSGRLFKNRRFTY